jgi:hypothetical protein
MSVANNFHMFIGVWGEELGEKEQIKGTIQ